MKVLITSDNHLGFKETDPIRAEDSFNTFDEILALARAENVDFVLQGGDLFHDNRPSRNTYNKTLQILKKYCLGESRPAFSSNIPLNFNNPNINIALPILSIHGNHDDPSGFNSVSPLDILQTGGLINYFGKTDDVDNIELTPILVEKNKRIAIFGLGYIKDRRLYKTFLKGNVRYKRPIGEDWFNILMAHQNRVPREGEYLPEDLIDPFFDLVIYGHEHESLRIRHRNFDVIQCGSSIRTSLCEGESFDKYAYVLDLDENPMIRRITLKTVRPLIMDSIKISNGDAETQIKDKIEEMLNRCKSSTEDGNSMLPLIRLRAEIDGSIEFNKHKVCSILENKVANPTESLGFIRKTEKRHQEHTNPAQKNEIEGIYKEILKAFNFKTLIQSKVLDSLKDFIEKDNRDAFTNLIKDSISGIVNNANFESMMADNIEEAIQTARDSLIKKENIEVSDEGSFKLEDDEISVSLSKPDLAVNLHFDDLCKTMPLPKESNSLSMNTSVLCSKEAEDFTFIEDKQQNKENRDLINKIKEEKINEESIKSEIKRAKVNDSSEDLFTFSKYF